MTDDLEDLALALSVAETAAEHALEIRSSPTYQIHTKGDLSPVTTADRRAEAKARRAIGIERPEDGFLGEEGGMEPGQGNGRIWVIDPIDATRNFVRGIPIWATLVALIENGKPVVGVVNAPDLGRCWWAAAGAGAYVGSGPSGRGHRIATRAAATIEDAYLSTTAFDTWQQYGLDDGYQRLTERSYCNRGFGDFYQHCLVAEGVLDAALEPVVAPWDVAALVPIIFEAGGICTDLMGVPLPGASTCGILSSAPDLHPKILEVFS